MRTSALVRFTLSSSFAGALFAGCGGSQPPIGAPDIASHISAAALPANLLYVLGGPRSTRHPSIEIFNALDNSKNPQPIYTIGPKENGAYGLLAVDKANNLFAVNYFENGAKLLTFPPGETRPNMICRLDNVPQGTFIARNTFYFTTKNYTAEEYSLPLHVGKGCSRPSKVITDQRAKLRGEFGLFGIAVDPHGNVFDVWDSSGGQRIDEFSLGSTKARRFVSLGQTDEADYMTSDSRGNLITNFGTQKPQSEAIAVLPPVGRPRKLFDQISDGTYLGVALADDDTELFSAKDYPATTVSAYAYDPTTGRVGRVLRTFSNIWYYAGSIAVFSRE
jgi:hypothetical protein